MTWGEVMWGDVSVREINISPRVGDISHVMMQLGFLLELVVNGHFELYLSWGTITTPHYSNDGNLLIINTNQPTNPSLDIPGYWACQVCDGQGGPDEQHVVVVLLCNYWTAILMLGARCDNNKLATSAIIISQVQLTHHQTPGPSANWVKIFHILYFENNFPDKDLTIKASLASVIRSVSSCIEGSRSALCHKIKLWSSQSVQSWPVLGSQWELGFLYQTVFCLQKANRPSELIDASLLSTLSSDNFLSTLLSRWEFKSRNDRAERMLCVEQIKWNIWKELQCNGATGGRLKIGNGPARR